MNDQLTAQAKVRQRKRAMLFASDQNPLWAALGELEDLAGLRVRAAWLKPRSGASASALPGLTSVPSKPHEWLGVSRPLVDSWKTGTVDEPESLRRQVGALRLALIAQCGTSQHAEVKLEAERLARCLEDFLHCIDDNASVLRSGAALGLSADKTRSLLDTAFDRIHPLLRLPYFSNETDALKALADLRGTHLTWLFREGRVLQCPTRFRYVVRLRGGHAIKVKLNVPVVHPTPDQQEAIANSPNLAPPAVEYDGWIMLSQPGRIFLSFETRDAGSHRTDLLHAVIDNYPDNERFRRGHYLTVHQDNAQSIIAERLLMQHLPDSQASGDNEALRSTFMRHSLRVIEAGEPEYAELLRRLGA